MARKAGTCRESSSGNGLYDVAPCVSSATTAKPSIIARANPGTFTRLTTSRANTRPAALEQRNFLDVEIAKLRQRGIDPSQRIIDGRPLRETAHADVGVGVFRFGTWALDSCFGTNQVDSRQK